MSGWRRSARSSWTRRRSAHSSRTRRWVGEAAQGHRAPCSCHPWGWGLAAVPPQRVVGAGQGDSQHLGAVCLGLAVQPRRAAMRHPPACVLQLLSAEILHHRGLAERLLGIADPLLRSCPEPLQQRLQVSGRSGAVPGGTGGRGRLCRVPVLAAGTQQAVCLCSPRCRRCGSARSSSSCAAGPAPCSWSTPSPCSRSSPRLTPSSCHGWRRRRPSGCSSPQTPSATRPSRSSRHCCR